MTEGDLGRGQGHRVVAPLGEAIEGDLGRDHGYPSRLIHWQAQHCRARAGQRYRVVPDNLSWRSMQVIGVAQVINKDGDGVFTGEDEEVCISFPQGLVVQ